MKRVLLLAGLTLLIAHLSFAQTGSICLFSDAEGNDCTISDMVPGLITVYVIHKNAVNVTGVRFAAPVPECMNAIFLGDTPQFPIVVGDSQSGVSIGYNTCVSSPINVLTINIFGNGLSGTDCPYPVIGDPAIGFIQVADCDGNLLAATGGITYVNSTLPCICGGTLPDPTLYVNPITLDFGAEETSKTFVIGNMGGGTLMWNVDESIPWIDAAPTAGTDGGAVTVTVDRSTLLPGHHSGLIHVTSNGGNETVTVLLDIELATPVIAVTPPSLNFAPTETSKNLTIANLGSGDLFWNITTDMTWLTVDPVSGVNDVSVLLTVDRTGLPDGYYNGLVMIGSNGGCPSVPVVMAVITEPVLSVNPLSLSFSQTGTMGTFTISNVGYGSLEWSLSADESWIEIVPPLSGVGYKTVTINVDPASMPGDEAQVGHVTVASNGGTEIVEIVYTPPGPSYGGTIGVFANTDGSDCNIHDVAPGLLEVYVVHNNVPGATACQFAAPMPACMGGAVWLSDAPQFPVMIGNSQNGVSIGYGECRSSPIHVMTINYFGQGLTSECCMYEVLPDPFAASGRIEVVDCNNLLLYADGMTSVVNPTDECYCGAIKVQETTWGKVKSLYAPAPPSATRR